MAGTSGDDLIVKTKPFIIYDPHRTFSELLGILVRWFLTPLLLPLVERNWFPDALLRYGIRREVQMELEIVKKLSVEQAATVTREFVEELKGLPIALATRQANEQHYEVNADFYNLVLGPHLKYSCGLWPSPRTTLAESEVHMLELYCERAGLVDGMRIVDLGCGWGSLTLFLAQKYPKSIIDSVSNSASQKEFILSTARARGLSNITVHTGDISSFDLPETLHGANDRVLSIEMFEHMKNYRLLMAKVARWLRPGGKIFIHIFTQRRVGGHYKEGWMTENFFTGGTLPSDDLLLYFQDDLRIEAHWTVNGAHYQKTLEAWLAEMYRKRRAVMPVLIATYGRANAVKWWVNWKLFFIGCAEFFGADGGEENIVSHYLFVK